MKQTAVEWLAEKYNYLIWLRNRDEISSSNADDLRKAYLKEAKEMERKQIINAWELEGDEYVRTGKDYYEVTFNKQV